MHTISYIGLDVHKATIAVAVADAVAEVKAAAHFVTERRGGRGAFREVVAFILQAQNHWDNSLKQF